MNRNWDDVPEGQDIARDVELGEVLFLIDPASRDQNYWLRFRNVVVSGAARELARRRMVARLTVGDVVTSWARALVPTALLAAVLAGIMLWRNAPMPISVEELLVSEIQGETIPMMLSPTREAEAVMFATEAF